MTAITDAYDDLALELTQDPDDDVTSTDDGLLVKGRRFAFLEGDRLVLRLPGDRVDDLLARGLARKHAEGDGWVAVPDVELWSELAEEAHAFVGEPPVGRQS